MGDGKILIVSWLAAFVFGLLSIAQATVATPAQATSAAETMVTAKWYDTGLRLPDVGRSLCVDSSQPNTVLAAGGYGNTFSYNWQTAQGVLLNPLPFVDCPSDGWLYIPDTVGHPALRFRPSQPDARPVAHIPVGVGPDGIAYAYEYTAHPPVLTSWSSSDGGITWQNHSYRFGADIESFTWMSDIRVLYVLVKNEIPPAPGMRTYSIYASADAGITWDQRSTGETPDAYNGSGNVFRQLAPVSGATAPVDLVQLIISFGSLAPVDASQTFYPAEVRLSQDSARSFPVRFSNSHAIAWQLVHTQEGILRLEQDFADSSQFSPLRTQTLALSQNGGQTWQLLPPLPPPAPGMMLNAGQLTVATAAPANVFLENAGQPGRLLYSPDGGHTWQQFSNWTTSLDSYTPYLPLTVLRTQPTRGDPDPRLLTPLPGHPTPVANATPNPGDYPSSGLYALDLREAGQSVAWPAGPTRAPGSRFFPPTGHNLGGAFQLYWAARGALAQQGYPLSEAFREVADTDGQVYLTQYFERAVLELHPENLAPYNVLGSLLGVFTYQQRYGHAGAPSQHASTDHPRYFPETGHTFGGPFRAYWETHGGLLQQGYPISDEFQEVSPLDGQRYTVQYFERAVFERHPENAGTPYEVLLSRLGTLRLRAKYAPGAPPGP